MTPVPFTVRQLIDALEELDDHLLVMLPGEDIYDWMYLYTVCVKDVDFPDEETEDGEPVERRCVVLDRE